MKISILGAGSFGTALAKLIAENGNEVCIWTRDQKVAHSINQNHENDKYLPDYQLPPQLISTTNINEATDKKYEITLFVIPTQFTRQVLENIKVTLNPDTPIVVCSKGIEMNTHNLVSDIFLDVLGESYKSKLFFLSGPSFAKEIAERIPTTVTMASYSTDRIAEVQSIFRSSYFKVYGSNDVVGVELSGALKNIVAIACGISEGLGMGLNSQAGLITRGLAEIARLGKKMGANPLTFMGLAGMGDIVLTCTGNLSRNRTVGIRIGEGIPLNEILKNMQQVTEGVTTSKSAYEIAQKHKIDTPIIDGVYEILYKQKKPKEVLKEMMSRDYKHEFE